MDEDGLSVSCGNGKLRQWLIDQIDSKSYPGLVWENDEKTIFRIPWKHAGKQDYNRDEDAALFKAWALFKGKFKEGVDRPDPPTWKTRLRCALNKSNDFDELVEKSQLDISEPYKVYRIIPEAAKRGMKMSHPEESSHLGYYPPYSSLQNQVSGYMERRDWRDFPSTDQQPLPPPPPHHHHHHPELQYHYPSALSRPWPTTHAENGFQLSFHTYLSESPAPVYTMDPNSITDFSLHVSLFYRESLVKEVTTTSPKGCCISSSAPSTSPSSSPRPDDALPMAPELILFPFPFPESHRQGAELLPNVLERGVQLWLSPEGLFAKRLCQSRVYWEGPLALYADKPNKLEKEQPCKLFDTQQFLIELQEYVHNGRAPPRHQVVLCFGDEYPDPQRSRKMITAQVEPVFARKLLFYYQQNNSHYLRTYEHNNQHPNLSPTPDYISQRPLQHIQE